MTNGRMDKLGRKLVQLGFLLLFLYPLVPLIYKRMTFKAAPTLTSWLLLWDPLLLIGQIARRDWPALVLGAPLWLMALTFVLGRFFCGWVCPVGTVLDFIRPIAFWQKRIQKRTQNRFFPGHANSPLRYYVLIGILAGALISLQFLGALDPLVVFQRTATALTSNAFALQQPALRAYLSLVSLVLIGIVILESWQPRFWCRNLCPLGALLGVFARWSLVNRRVSELCNGCGDCRRLCPMNAIPLKEPHDTNYGHCTLCLECETACDKHGISFSFGALAGKRWRREGPVRTADGALRLKGHYAPVKGSVGGIQFSRRQVIGGLAAGGIGLAFAPLTQLTGRRGVIRPPGALPEDEFVRTCILCQECVRVCPTGGLRPTFLESGLAGIGTPQLIPRQGGCALNPSCPDLCAQVCPVGAIRPLQPDQIRLGLASVDRSLCLAWDQGVKCIVCVEACLVDAAQFYNGRVTVDPNKCTGCGRCESGCPVAGSAIRVYTL